MRTKVYGVVLILLVGLTLLTSIPEVVACSEGCTPGFWKNWRKHPWPWELQPMSNTVGEFFAAPIDFEGDTLLDALKYHGGPGVTGATRVLLRAAVAALLNAADVTIDYLPEWEVKSLVNQALASNDRPTMLDVAAQLDAMNNLGCD
jgi:hypothetical protein